MHLDLLEESILRQKELARDFQHLWIGIATGFLYEEEREPLTRIRELLRAGGRPADVRAEFDRVSSRLTEYAPELAQALQDYLRDQKNAEEVQKRLASFSAKVPAGFYPPEKLARTMERVRKAGAEGIVIFSAGGIGSAGLWDTVAKSFADGR
jgi:predicted AAA+ superfamily ATPase